MNRIVIDRLGHRGDGVAGTPEGPVYAAFALPGETVEGTLSGDRLTVERVVVASPDRVAPPCPQFGICGGCALQHAGDGSLAAWKTEQVRAALAARGLETAIRPIHVSPPGARRRVALAARRLKAGVVLGFHGRAAHVLVPVTACPVARPEIVAALPAAAEIAGLVATRRSEVRTLATWTEGGLDLALEGGRALDGALAARLARAAETADLARLSLDGEVVAARRPPVLRMGRAALVPPPGGFLQATADGEAALWAAVAEAVGDARRVADLFAGAGTFALRLVERAAVRAVESDAAALAALAAAWRGVGGLRPLEAERRDLFRRPLAPAELAGVDAVVFDPPRAGAAAQTAALAASTVPRIAAVSCNPATFARDARTLVDGGYRLLWVRPVDQFRWTPHVELAAAFARPRRGEA